MKVGDLVQWILVGKSYKMLGIVVNVDEMGFRVHWADGFKEWYEYWGEHEKHIRKL